MLEKLVMISPVDMIAIMLRTEPNPTKTRIIVSDTQEVDCASVRNIRIPLQYILTPKFTPKILALPIVELPEFDLKTDDEIPKSKERSAVADPTQFPTVPDIAILWPNLSDSKHNIDESETHMDRSILVPPAATLPLFWFWLSCLPAKVNVEMPAIF